MFTILYLIGLNLFIWNYYLLLLCLKQNINTAAHGRPSHGRLSHGSTRQAITRQHTARNHTAAHFLLVVQTHTLKYIYFNKLVLMLNFKLTEIVFSFNIYIFLDTCRVLHMFPGHAHLVWACFHAIVPCLARISVL